MFSRSKRSSKKLGHAAWSAASTPGKGHGGGGGGGGGGSTTPLKRARLRGTPRNGDPQRNAASTSTPLNPSNPPNPSNLSNRAPLSASSTAAALPAGLRSLQGRLPALLQARLAASRQHGGAAGRVSPSGRWHTVVCEGALFVWAASANHASTSAPPLLATIDLPDTQSVDADQLGRLCVLENDASPSNTAAPTMLYVTPWGEVQCWHMIGRADSADANGRLPDLATGKTLSLSPLCF